MSSTASQPASRSEVAVAPAATGQVPSQPDQVTHEVRVVDGRFMHAECSCGWRTAGRRSRSTARTEARDHALLHAGTAL